MKPFSIHKNNNKISIKTDINNLLIPDFFLIQKQKGVIFLSVILIKTALKQKFTVFFSITSYPQQNKKIIF